MITKLAVKWLTWQLRKDEGFWIAYQANIAMSFYDRFWKYFPEKTIPYPTDVVLAYCNDAANDFMKLWTKPSK
jgi:hypothetical protein